MSLLMGIDLGTESVRVAIYQVDGQEVASASVPITTVVPDPGRAEQNPIEWWEAICSASKQCMSQLPTKEIAGIGLATTASTVVACREDGTLLRSAILWMDTRAWKESQDSAAQKHPILRYSGGADAAEWLVPKALWIARHEPEIYSNSAHIVEAIDFLVHKLTGEWVASLMNATCKANYDSINGTYADDLYAALGAPDLSSKFSNRVIPVGDAIAHITATAAEEMGISNRPLVGQGGIDAHTAMLASGNLSEDHIFMIGGTSNVLLALTEKETPARGIWGPYPHALVKDLWLLEGGQISAGSILRWVTRKLLNLSDDESLKIANVAAGLDPSSNSLLVLDYWMGNRSPYRDDQLRGAILGLSLNHTPADIYRAAVESISFGTRHVVETFAAAGVGCTTMTLSGGIARNKYWLKTNVDVLGIPVQFSEATNMTTLAGAICAASALGLHGDLTQAAKAMKVETHTLEPDLAHTDYYAERFAMYKEATSALTPTFHQLAGSTT